MLTESTPSKSSAATWTGLFIALFGMLIVRQIVTHFYPTLTFEAAVWKESLIWALAIALLILVRRGERLPFTSIGFGTTRWQVSILWGLILTVICLVLAVALAALTHYGHGPGSAAFEKLPTWLLILIIVRAGVVEELFYRGYAIERLQAIGLNRYAAAALPLIIFGLGHWTGGWANIVIAIVLGGVSAAYYLWKRDLVAVMIAHFMVDFLGNILPKILHHEG